MKKAFVDMDGVIASFIGGMENAGEIDPKVFKLKRGSYLELPVYDYAQDLFDLLEEKGYEVHILTKIPRLNPFAATEKLLWIEKYFPQYLDVVTITHDKGAVGCEDDILIDDRPHKANCEGFRGKLIHWVEGMLPEDIEDKI